MNDNVAAIKSKIDIVDLIGGYLKLQKAGVNFKARCPFHNEKSGSFFVSPERQVWHCFGCGLGGDMFEFVQRIEGTEFIDALRTLAVRAGVELTHSESSTGDNKQVLYQICELAGKFFEKQIWNSNAGNRALEYLRGRALHDETIRLFRLGYAPDQWRGLSDFLGKHFKEKDIVTAGLSIQKQQGGIYDRFRSRIMFPIFDATGRVVAFSGRIFHADGMAPTDEEAKYVNSSQTPIYNKSALLYGFDKAKLDIRRTNRCLVVEGNLDVVLSHQAGATHTVATCGTALTDHHLVLLKRYTDQIDLCFDADSAGIAATEKAVRLALARGLTVGVVAFEDSEIKDPADYVKKYGEQWRDQSRQSHPFIEYYLGVLRRSHDETEIGGKKQISQKLLPYIAALSSKIEQAHWITELALAIRIDEAAIIKELASVHAPLVETVSPEVPHLEASSPNERPFDILEEALLTILFHEPTFAPEIGPDDFLSPYCQRIVRHIVELADRKDSGSILDRMVGSGKGLLTMDLEFVYLKSQELWADISGPSLHSEFERILEKLKKRAISKRLTTLAYDIKRAERAHDQERITMLLGEFSKISGQLKS